MSMDILATPGIELLKLGLDASALRQAAISSNIANANTPGYRPLKVSFEEQLQGLVSGDMTTADWSSVKPRLAFDEDAGAVAIDQQMLLMSQNYVYYQSLLKAITGKFALFEVAINGR